jgi:hypothetical protein
MYKGVLIWDVKLLSTAMGISEEDTIKYFTDGRRISFLIERRLCNEVAFGTLPESEGAPYDFKDHSGRIWEVRSVTKQGVYFCPSNMKGSGRSFDEKGFIDKLDLVDGYFLADITTFPVVEYWTVTSDDVKNMYLNGELSKTSDISRDKVIRLTKGQ